MAIVNIRKIVENLQGVDRQGHSEARNTIPENDNHCRILGDKVAATDNRNTGQYEVFRWGRTCRFSLLMTVSGCMKSVSGCLMAVSGWMAVSDCPKSFSELPKISFRLFHHRYMLFQRVCPTVIECRLSTHIFSPTKHPYIPITPLSPLPGSLSIICR